MAARQVRLPHAPLWQANGCLQDTGGLGKMGGSKFRNYSHRKRPVSERQENRCRLSSNRVRALTSSRLSASTDPLHWGWPRPDNSGQRVLWS